MNNEIPGWILSGANPAQFAVGVDEQERFEGGRVAYLRSTAGDVSGFGTLMQQIAADEYRDTRLRLTAMVRTEDVEGWAGLWLRVDGRTPEEMLAFDNMQDRAIRGTTAWTRHSVVLDVPAAALGIAFGLLLAGPGAVLIAGARFESVGPEIETTGSSRSLHPVNLDFSDPF